ncbi:ASKHA domain-containing protein [Opitutus terrae]|uniref:Ferredoxin n=1 Tax=Opitutus terrae (strain DSM 11246 / JCM 15787 / PB90-1) TaxID=452637 RepID=B1ZRG3_OPITP|nr:ASKHA domain-containing protein [Opitutus terrae]ACB77613.1 ferredoxin [Opitutus terrae PB90-1]
MSVQLHVNHRTCDAPAGGSLFDYATSVGVQVPTSCNKQGRCKECVVEVTEGMERLSERVPAEQHLKGAFRLSCCTRVIADEGTVRCHTMRRGEMRIEKHAFALPVQRQAWQLDPAVTRDGERILLDGQEIARSPGAMHGLAIDLGTTTVVIRLLNLETGEVIADSSFENPQRFGGSDVMARIQYDTEDRTKTLQRTLVGYLSHAIQELPVDPQSIYEVVLAGNSTMRDLFFRLSVYSIGQSPYRSITELELAEGKRATTSLAVEAKRLGLPIHPKARVYGLPIISGHVGADAAACMLAVDLAHEERTVAIMDIGTNTELIVGNKHRVLAASCPAGPAFEGGQITFGMPGLPGAIEKVAIAEGGAVRVGVIGDGAPEGLCGSGLVDLLGELLRTGRINALGRFEHGPEEFVVAQGADQPVTFSEADINALAQAKGANVAGLQIAFAEYGIRPADLEVFYLAGGFGRHLNIESAKRIGLIPNLPAERILQVGNASVEGACIALLSRTKRAELEQLVRRVTHCRLETHPGFFDFFVEGCQFGPVGGVEVSEP